MKLSKGEIKNQLQMEIDNMRRLTIPQRGETGKGKPTDHNPPGALRARAQRKNYFKIRYKR